MISDITKKPASLQDSPLYEGQGPQLPGQDCREFVEEVHGIAYINDAASSFLFSVERTLQTIDTSVVLITGLGDKDNDYSKVKSVFESRVVGIIYLGERTEEIIKCFSKHSMLFVRAYNLKEALLYASCFARPGDVVLFSPGGKDLKKSSRELGNDFRKLVQAIK